MKTETLIWIALITCMASQLNAEANTIDLRGTWSFQLDDARVGEPERWFEKDLTDEILKGSVPVF